MISRAFADVLAAGRSNFNRRVREAQRRHPAFRAELFQQFLEGRVDPLVGAVADVERARLPALVYAAFDIALELTGRALVGPAARSSLLDDVWRGLLPHFARQAAAQPQRVLGMLSNAAVYLGALPDVRCTQWMDEMAALAPAVISVEQLHIVGQITAWRAGAAHFRSGAIAAADALPEALALQAFAASGASSWAALRACIEPDPWWTGTDSHAAREREIGRFTGFGGLFPEPPDVRPGNGGFVVRSGDRYFLLIADAYGAVLQSANVDEFEQTASARERCDYTVSGNRLMVGSQSIALDLPEAGLSVCATDTTIAIASPYTHAVRLLARERA
jgi:hypothetical protein